MKFQNIKANTRFRTGSKSSLIEFISHSANVHMLKISEISMLFPFENLFIF